MSLPEDDRTSLSASTEEPGPDEPRDSARRPVATPQVPVVALPAETAGETERFVKRGTIGRGGMGTVHRVYDKDLRREVAVKVLDPHAGGSQAERFIEEARITGQLEHPNIVPVYDLGTDADGAPYLCMKLVQGETLDHALHRAGDLRLEPDKLIDFLQVFGKVCDAVSFAHSRGVIHRDLKPSNIMISDFGQVYLMDWGVAKLLLASPGDTHAHSRMGSGEEGRYDQDPPGALIGTPSYMPPEQVRGLHDQLDERTDVFALGATLYQILTTKPPFGPESLRAVWMRAERVRLPPPEEVVRDGKVPAELSRIAMKAMAYDPADRYASVSELKTDIERFQRGAWHLPRVAFPAGTVILTQGEQGEAAYIIVQGTCVAYRTEGVDKVQLREMGPDDVFGETAIFSEKPRSASIRATTDMVLMVVTREILSNALGLNFWMGSFVKALADRFRDVDERLRSLEQETRRTPKG